jgi:hypothetical protein
MKIRNTFTIALETADPTESNFKNAIEILEIATRDTKLISKNGYPIIEYTAPRIELELLLIDFWDMEGAEAEKFVFDHPSNL